MEKEQVIKDIEELLEGHCCLDYKHSDPICGYDTIKDALALIKELTEENEAQAETIKNLIETIKGLPIKEPNSKTITLPKFVYKGGERKDENGK